MSSFYLPSGSKIGAGYVAHRLANAMVSLGHQVTMFSPCDVTEDAKYEHVTVPLAGPLLDVQVGHRSRPTRLEEFDIYHSHGDDHFRRRRTTPPHIRTLYGSCFSEAWHIRGGKERLRMLALGVTEFLAPYGLTAPSPFPKTVGDSFRGCQRSFPAAWIWRCSTRAPRPMNRRLSSSARSIDGSGETY